MAMLKFEVPSALQPDEARKRVEALLKYWNRKYGVAATWAGEKATMAGKAMGLSFDGWLHVLDGKVSGEASDPGFMLRGQAQKYLTKKFGQYLDPKKTLEEIVKGED